jgi:tetratricopeptide (TPR) repeat protein
VWDKRPVLVVFLLALAVHLPSLGCSFVYDDHYEILGDGYMRQSNPWIAFQINLWDLYDIQSNAESSYYRPMIRVLLWCTYQLAGPQAWAFHLVNTVVDALSCAMVTELGRQFFRSSRVALWGGLLFAVHPRHVESVAWATSLCDLFCWSTALAYLLLALKAARERRPGLWVLASLALLLSALTKESGLLTPGLAVLLFLFALPADRVRLGSTLAGLVASAGAAWAIYFYLRVGIAHTGWPGSVGDPFWHRLQQGPYVFAYLTRLAVWPFGYGLFRGPILQATPQYAVWWLSLLFLIVFVSLLVLTWKRWPQVCFCLLWWGYCVAPVLGVLAPLPSLMSDRHIYLGVAALGWLLGLLSQRYPGSVWKPLVVAMALVFAGMTQQQIRVWSDEVELWRQSKRTCPHNTSPRVNLAFSLVQRQQYQAALAEYRELIELGPEFITAYIGVANVQLQLGQYAQAEQILKMALERKVEPRARLLERLGAVYQAQDRHSEAVREFRESMRLAPRELGVQFLLANSLARLNQFDEARQLYRAILKAYPRSPGARHNLPLLDYQEAVFLRERGKVSEAEACLGRLLSQPDLSGPLRVSAQQELAKIRAAQDFHGSPRRP